MNPQKQSSAYQSPWPWGVQLLLICWRLSWLVLCRWTPKFFNPWRVFVLKTFGASLSGMPFIHSTARIQIPWNLTMRHRACLGEFANAYSLGNWSFIPCLAPCCNNKEIQPPAMANAEPSDSLRRPPVPDFSQLNCKGFWPVAKTFD